MKQNPKQMHNPEDKSATRGCLKTVEDRIELLQDCLNGKETQQRPLIVQSIKEARKHDDEALATIDKEIADLKSQIKELKLQATKFRAEIQGG